MATFLELAQLVDNSDFQVRIRFGFLVIAAETLDDSGAPPVAKEWAEEVLRDAPLKLPWREIFVRVALRPAIQAAGAAATDAEIKAAILALRQVFARRG